MLTYVRVGALDVLEINRFETTVCARAEVGSLVRFAEVADYAVRSFHEDGRAASLFARWLQDEAGVRIVRVVILQTVFERPASGEALFPC